MTEPKKRRAGGWILLGFVLLVLGFLVMRGGPLMLHAFTYDRESKPYGPTTLVTLTNRWGFWGDEVIYQFCTPTGTMIYEDRFPSSKYGFSSKLVSDGSILIDSSNRRTLIRIEFPDPEKPLIREVPRGLPR